MSFSGKTTVIFISCSFALLRSKQPEFLKQEIYSRLILYNFGIFIANEAAEENRKKKRDGSNKYLYELDFSSALKTARKFFMRRDSGRHIDIIRLMMKYVAYLFLAFWVQNIGYWQQLSYRTKLRTTGLMALPLVFLTRLPILLDFIHKYIFLNFVSFYNGLNSNLCNFQKDIAFITLHLRFTKESYML